MDFSTLVPSGDSVAGIVAALVAMGVFKIGPNVARWAVGKLNSFFDVAQTAYMTRFDEDYIEHIERSAILEKEARQNQYLSDLRERLEQENYDSNHNEYGHYTGEGWRKR